VSQLKVSFWGEFGSFERRKGWISHSGVHPSIFIRFRMPPCPGGMDGRGKVFESLHLTPVRRGWVARARDGRWSSAAWFAGLEGNVLVPDLIPPEWTVEG
jgi:hypothetical protein